MSSNQASQIPKQVWLLGTERYGYEKSLTCTSVGELPVYALRPRIV